MILTRFKKLIKVEFTSFFIGSVLTAIIAVILWLISYFGYTNLGLPARFDYQILDKLVSRSMPAGYSYRLVDVKGFRGPDTDTVLAIGHSEQYDKNIQTYKQKYNTQDLSDLIILFDKTSRGYKESYRFKPVQGTSSSQQYPALITGFTGSLYGNNAYTNSSGNNDIILGWFYVGANSSPPVPILFSDNNGNVSVSSINPSEPPYKKPSNGVATISNYYNPKQSFPAGEVDNIFTNKNYIAFSLISNFVCDACDNNTYEILYYQDVGGQLKYRYIDSKQITGVKNLYQYFDTSSLTL